MSHNKITDSPTFCPMLWKSITYSVSSHFSPCCDFDHKVDPFDKNFWSLGRQLNQYLLKEVRQASATGKRHKACQRCWDTEDGGGYSSRMEAIQSEWWNRTDQTITDTDNHNPAFYDLKLSNVCNLGCRHCDPVSSSVLENEVSKNPIEYKDNHMTVDVKFLQKLRPKMIDSNIILDEIINNQNVKTVKFTGGEPFLNRDIEKFIQLALKKGISQNLDIEFTSNLTLLPRWLITKKQYFRSLRIRASLETVGNPYTYLRWPFTWRKFQKNWKTLDSIKHINSGFSLTLHALSVFYAPETIEWLTSHQKKFIPCFVSDPEWLRVENLPKNIKDNIKQRLDRMISSSTDHITINGINFVLNELEKPGDEEKFQKLMIFEAKRDTLRSQKMLDFMPEFVHLTDNCLAL